MTWFNDIKMVTTGLVILCFFIITMFEGVWFHNYLEAIWSALMTIIFLWIFENLKDEEFEKGVYDGDN